MWRPTMLLLCLIAALSGTPLRQAEAANDFARSLAEFGEDHHIEIIDGGVGDDSGATILKAGGDPHSLPATIPLAIVDGFLTPLSPALCAAGNHDRRRANRIASHPSGSIRRHAWLQCFLI